MDKKDLTFKFLNNLQTFKARWLTKILKQFVTTQKYSFFDITSQNCNFPTYQRLDYWVHVFNI